MTYTWSSYLQVYNKKQFSFTFHFHNLTDKYSHFKVLTEEKTFSPFSLQIQLCFNILNGTEHFAV